MIKLNDPDCVGCGACVAACPKKCIQIVINDNGEYAPIVNFNECIYCHNCSKVCLVEKKDFTRRFPITTLWGYCANKEQTGLSSSGGIFYALAQYILDNDGYVCGASFNDDFEVVHSLIKSKNDLHKLQGSKYTESILYPVLDEIKTILKTGKTLLFTGVPCHIAALKNYLGRDYHNLICCEIFCHGMPRIGVFAKYVSFLKLNYGKIRSFNFRDKQYGWNIPSYKIKFDNNKILNQKHNENIYHLMFGYHLSLKKSCFNCKLRDKKRIADISIGDYWGVERFHNELDIKDGISAILLNSDKGAKLFFEVNNIVYGFTNYNSITTLNKWLVCNYPLPSGKQTFDYLYRTLPANIFFILYLTKLKYINRIEGVLRRIFKYGT